MSELTRQTRPLRDAPGGRGGAAGGREVAAAEALVVDVDGFEGPLDLLLTLARTQKVDLAKISILQLAEQYLAFVEAAKARRIELAADYLVTAAWLAYLKSRLLLPPEPAEEGPSAEDLAARLAFRLERLEAMRRAAARLMARDRLGREVFARGAPEAATTTVETEWECRLVDLLRAYARLKTRDDYAPLHLRRPAVLSMEQAIARMRVLLGAAPPAGGWRTLAAFLPPEWLDRPERRRAATAACFAASLELVRRGELEIRQERPFGAIDLRTPA